MERSGRCTPSGRYGYPYDYPTSAFQCRSDKPISKLGYKIIFRGLVGPPK